MLVVLILTLGLASPGESARVSHTGCINYFSLKMDGTNKRVAGLV